MNINLDDLTLKQIKEISALVALNQPASVEPKLSHPYTIGHDYMVRTVTMIYIGRLTAVHPQELVLEDASWIPETGRWADFIANGSINECEPYPDGAEVVVPRVGFGSLDITEWEHKLPREQK